MAQRIGRCPQCGRPLSITQLSCAPCGLKIEGSFSNCKFCQLEQEQLNFLEVFVKCRGVIREVEKELGLSYPTVRSRLDDLIAALGHPAEPPREDE